jgi:magnesium-protoporphyrin IX monomethyl ester (oxidative) cyclase
VHGAQRVLLFCLPYQHLRLSSLSTAHLGTLLREHGFSCSEVYVHFELARLMGPERYQEITDGMDGLSGELLFAEALQGGLCEPDAEEKLLRLFGPAERRREMVQALERFCLSWVERERPSLVGMSTSFNQLTPALWLARVIKRAGHPVRVVLGGSACSEPMGPQILDAYPEVDLVVSGYGEEPLLALSRGEEPEQKLIRSTRPVDLERLPIPDYGPFLEQAREFAEDPQLMLTFESSRGCWWGQVNHCTFCGLNGVEMAFYEKSSPRVVKEVRALWERYRRNLFATDTIMSRDHLKRAMPELASFSEGPRLFYEVKANMTQADVVTLRRANVLTLQPGIESLSTRLLGLLKKGINTIRNLALLKWCRERGISLVWNQLCGIPGERAEDYDAQIALMQLIPHLPPPDGVNPVHVDRYSPYFDKFGEFGWTELSPLPEYRLLHPGLEPGALRDIAYHFSGVGGVSVQEYLPRFQQAVKEWRQRCTEGEGLFLDPEQGLVRNGKEHGLRYPLDSVIAGILETTHEVTSISHVLTVTRCPRPLLVELERHGILFIEGESVLNLAVRTNLRI